jgi:hypothetical protein
MPEGEPELILGGTLAGVRGFRQRARSSGNANE